jgi:hypothetical protein
MTSSSLRRTVAGNAESMHRLCGSSMLETVWEHGVSPRVPAKYVISTRPHGRQMASTLPSSPPDDSDQPQIAIATLPDLHVAI